MAAEREEFWGAPYPILEESRIGAILPEYGPTGDGVRIVVVGGPDIRLEVQLKTVLRRLAAVHGRTLPALREAVSRQILKKTGLPLAISSSLVLLPRQSFPPEAWQQLWKKRSPAESHAPEPSPRGEGAELARRMRCHRAESRARLSFVTVL
jgi:hypothetical protein